MKIQRTILTTKFHPLFIESEDPAIVNHFNEGNHYADIIINQINYERIYDSMLRGRENRVILDIGANIGLFALYAQDCTEKLYALEPTPAHFGILTQLTKPYSNIVCLPVALHHEDTEVDFYLSEENTTMNSLANQYGKSIKVVGQKLKTILDFHKIDHVDFVKCDIEGGEMTALTQKTLSEIANRIDAWFVEVHATPKGNIFSNRESLKDLFRHVGYDVQDVRHDGFYAEKTKTAYGDNLAKSPIANKLQA